jgi:hypothetical protein
MTNTTKNNQNAPKADEESEEIEFSEEADRPETHAEFRKAARKAMKKHAKAFANLAK